MSVVKKLAGETLVYGMGAILPKILNFLVLGLYLTHKLPTGKYAIHAIVYAFVALLMVITTFRMETAFFRFANKKGNEISKTFSTAFLSVSLLSFLSFGILLLFSTTFAVWLKMPEHPEYIRYFAWIILFDALAAPAFARLRIENRALRFSYIKIINVVVNIVLILFLLELTPWLMEHQPNWVNWFFDPDKTLDYVFIANLGASAVVLLLLAKEIFKDRFIFDKILFLKMITYASPLIIVGIAGVINNFSDRYLLLELLPNSLVENKDIVGAYTGSSKIAVLMSMFITAFNYAAEPFFFKQAHDKNKDKAYANIALAFSAIGGLIFLGILMYLDIIKYIIASSYHKTIDVVPVLLLAYLFLGLFYNFSIWYKISDKTYYGAIVASIGSVILLTLSFYLIPHIGYIGAAWSILVCYIFMTVTIYLLGQKHHPIAYPIGKISINIILAITLYLLSNILIPYIGNIGIRMMINSVFILIYLGIIYKYEWKEIIK